MNLEISYPELNLINRLLKKEKMRIWREDFLPKLKDKSDKNVIKVFKEMMESEVSLKSIPMFELDCCKLLLQKIRNVARKVKEDIERVS